MANHVMTAPRDGIHSETHWWAGAFAGIIAGLVFMMMEMALIWLVKGESPWGPPRMMAAMIMGQGVLPPPATFDIGIMMMAMMVHMVMSIIYGLTGAWIVHRFDLRIALLIGAVYGFAIYVINFHIVVPAMFSWFVMARGVISELAPVFRIP